MRARPESLGGELDASPSEMIQGSFARCRKKSKDYRLPPHPRQAATGIDTRLVGQPTPERGCTITLRHLTAGQWGRPGLSSYPLEIPLTLRQSLIYYRTLAHVSRTCAPDGQHPRLSVPDVQERAGLGGCVEDQAHRCHHKSNR
ncbi:hypothetical protein CGRA01v4_03436 [Colletotrichum graminicola]|nr:hypothetical protein CGRA01v4_03436 [Colletotrichum graminicola]